MLGAPSNPSGTDGGAKLKKARFFGFLHFQALSRIENVGTAMCRTDS
ncbi:MAG: hypothetical protein KDG50_00410 [Chromatiales bacterium]|nr:hypothetical protein [Chromatiales bacterium]